MSHCEDSPESKIITSMEKEVEENSKKIANFISHFLSMAELYCKDASGGKLKGRLKAGWRWIK